MASPPLRPLFILVFLLLGAACSPKIGDDCQTSVDCSQGAERLCDITQPGGYCTVFNCEPGNCPEESTCIAFGAELSIVEGCGDGSGLSRLQRTFCMATCGSDADCRSGYLCADLKDAESAPRNVRLIDLGRSSKVCVANFTAAPPTELDVESGVCSGPNTPPAGTGGTSASGGGSGTGGSGGGVGGGGGGTGPGGGTDGGEGNSEEGGSPGSSGAGGGGG